MPYPSDPKRYPDYFLQLFKRAMKQELRVNMGAEGQASNIRHQLHAYRRALETAHWPNATELRNVTVSVEGTDLVMKPNQALEMLKNAAGPLAPTPEDTRVDDQLEAYIRQAFGESNETTETDESN